jgi:hypothetical protein
MSPFLGERRKKALKSRHIQSDRQSLHACATLDERILIKFGIVLMSHSRGIFFICIYKY